MFFACEPLPLRDVIAHHWTELSLPRGLFGRTDCCLVRPFYGSLDIEKKLPNGSEGPCHQSSHGLPSRAGGQQIDLGRETSGPSNLSQRNGGWFSRYASRFKRDRYEHINGSYMREKGGMGVGYAWARASVSDYIRYRSTDGGLRPFHPKLGFILPLM